MWKGASRLVSHFAWKMKIPAEKTKRGAWQPPATFVPYAAGDAEGRVREPHRKSGVLNGLRILCPVESYNAPLVA